MKRHIHFIFISFFCFNNIFALTQFTKGVNLTNWFQAENISQINFTKFTQEDFKYLKSIGSNIIRLPINFHAMIIDSSIFKIDPYIFFLLDKTCDWAEEEKINLIIDNHSINQSSNLSINRSKNTEQNVEEILIPIWKQISEHFKNRTNLIYYEVLNEPHEISNFNWNKIQQKVVSEIRNIDSVHTIIVGAANFNNYKDLDSLQLFDDKNIIYTFHFYEPFLFTHQGASWINPSMEKVKNIPFPYSKEKMPYFDSSFSQTWIESIYNKYKIEGTNYNLSKLIQSIAKFKEEKNVEIFCGEFGSLKSNLENKGRNNWYKFISENFSKNNIPWTIWDFNGDFGLFNNNSKIDLNLLQSLDFTPISYLKVISENNEFNIFSDFTESGIQPIKSNNKLNIKFSDEDKIEGDYSILWKNAERYNSISFDFLPDKELEKLIDKNAALKFSVKFSHQNIKIDLRFTDSKIDEKSDQAWRNSFPIISNETNKWIDFFIPLKEFKESGAYENGVWQNPKNNFDWQNVDKLEFVSEFESLLGKSIFIDDIKIIIPK
ncbi:MAG: cellulase family glycosylhydrolase [Melioribacteraceae bacterium]